MYNAPALRNSNAKTVLERIRELKADFPKSRHFSILTDTRADGKGEEIRARFYSIYKFENAGGQGERVVAHFTRGVGIPMIVKLDSMGNLCIDADCAMQLFDGRIAGGVERAFKDSEHFFPHVELAFEDEAVMIKLNSADVVDLAKNKDVASVNVPV